MSDEVVSTRMYYVSYIGWPEADQRVHAKSRAQAIYKQWLSARDAGYVVKWTNFRAQLVSK